MCGESENIMTNSDLINQAVRPFRRRLGLFAAGRAALAALTAGSFVFAAVTLGCKIARAGAADPEELAEQAERAARFSVGPLPWIVSGAAALIVLIAAFLILRPNQNETARRIDALGLKERASAMLALRNYPHEIAALQREDALRRLASVKPAALRGTVRRSSVLLLLLALLTAGASVLIPADWFVRERDEAAEVWEDALNLLREERDRLKEAGEDRLAGELDELIGEMEETDSLLRAVGEIGDAEEGVKDAAREGEASRDAMNEALDVLGEVRRMLLGEEEAGEEGEAGTEGEGMTQVPVPGEGEDGMEGEGPLPGEGEGEGPGTGGGRPTDGDERGQGSGEGKGEGIPSNMTEPVYDPISGAVPYGKVFSAYYSDYLRGAENGEIPYEVEDAARAYFEDLDR